MPFPLLIPFFECLFSFLPKNPLPPLPTPRPRYGRSDDPPVGSGIDVKVDDDGDIDKLGDTVGDRVSTFDGTLDVDGCTDDVG